MKQEEVLFFLGSIVIVVFAWIAFTLIHNSLTSTISQEVTQAIIPIAPTFDMKTITKMHAKPTVVPQNSIQPPSQTSIVVTTAPTVVPTEQPLQPIATSSGQTATTGGSLK